MAQSSFPFESIDTTETQFSQWARNIGEGVKGSLAGTELKVTAGTGLQVVVGAGQAMVRGHYYVSTASENLTIGTAHATNPRIDSIVLTLDPTANTIVLAVVAGTAASSPVPATLTQTDAGVYQYRLATVLVPATATSVSTITDTRTFLGSKSSADIATGMSDQAANYTLQATDRNTFIRSTGSAITVTIANVLAKGESVNFVQAGAGQITFSAGSGVTLYSADNLNKTAKQYAQAGVVSDGAGVYYLTGNLGA